MNGLFSNCGLFRNFAPTHAGGMKHNCIVWKPSSRKSDGVVMTAITPLIEFQKYLELVVFFGLVDWTDVTNLTFSSVCMLCATCICVFDSECVAFVAFDMLFVFFLASVF